MRWILPVKDPRRGKSRLSVPGADRQELILAMLRDTLEAVLATGRGQVVLVGPAADVEALSHEYGAGFLRHGGVLNEAIAAACSPELLCAALLPDLPALRAEDLDDVLSRNARGYVPDAAGTGTTLALDQGLVPRFGPGSAAAFHAVGLPRLTAAPSLRRDVDTAGDLAAAEQLGLGRHTAALLARVRGRPDVRTGP